MTYTITNSNMNGRSVVTVIDENGAVFTFSNENPIFSELVQALSQGMNAEARRLMTHGGRVRDDFLRLTDNVTIRGNDIYYGEEKLYGRLAEQIMDLHSRGDRAFRSLVRFLENLQRNPSFNSRTQLYEFLDRYDFAITEEGKFVAYKGVRSDYTSIHSGFGIVDGEEMTGNLPNKVGSTVEVPRRMVDDDINAACSFGLHAGTWEYASAFGNGATLTVEIDPADVVSVPHDVSHQKIRTCRYVVTDRAEQEINLDDWYLDEYDYDEDEDEYDEEYDDWLENEEALNEEYEEIYDEVVSSLIREAQGYSRKGKVGSSYRAIYTRYVRRPLDHTEESIVDDLDDNHEAGAVYRYHIDRLT